MQKKRGFKLSISKQIYELYTTQKGNRTVVWFTLVFIVSTFAVALLTEKGYVSFGRCIYKKYLGVNCPSCGATRATISLLQLNLQRAFWYNPLYLVLLVFFIVFFVRFSYNAFSKHYKPPVFKQKYLVYILLLILVIILYTVIRNLPFYGALFFQ